MNPIEQLQADIFGRIDADDYFVDIPAYLVRPRSQEEFAFMQTQLDNVLAGITKKAGKSGAAPVQRQ